MRIKCVVLILMSLLFLQLSMTVNAATNNTSFNYGRPLSYGKSGQDVRQLQMTLKTVGYNIAVDGNFGPTTKKAVQRFQSDNGLKADGIVGSATAKKLNEKLNGKIINTPSESTPINTEGVPSKGYLIVINKSNNTLTLFKDKEIVKKYSVATGKQSSYTPEGKFTIVVKYVNPAWGGGGYAKPIKGGVPENPLGYRWMGLSIKGGGTYGIHGTNAPNSIGTYASKGCIRMLNSQVEELYDIVPKGTPVWIGTTSKLKSWKVL